MFCSFKVLNCPCLSILFIRIIVSLCCKYVCAYIYVHSAAVFLLLNLLSLIGCYQFQYKWCTRVIPVVTPCRLYLYLLPVVTTCRLYLYLLPVVTTCRLYLYLLPVVTTWRLYLYLLPVHYLFINRFHEGEWRYIIQ